MTQAPAFPQSMCKDEFGEIHTSDVMGNGRAGMSLRAWLAGQALTNGGICSGAAHEYELRNWFGERGGVTREEIAAKQAVAAADALLRELSN